MPDDLQPVKRALISVSDKRGLADFAGGLAKLGIELISTGGTARAIREAGFDCRDVADITGFPEMMDGRIKTLHPRIHGGLLAIRTEASHAEAQAQHAIPDIDLLVVNLYPFEASVAAGADYAGCVENIDIGGPAMIRAGAKNHRFVTVIVDPDDYSTVLDELGSNNGQTGFALRQKLATRAYARTAAYDAAIADWLTTGAGDDTPVYRSFSGKRGAALRYGENPHQSAAVYVGGPQRPGVLTARQLQGKGLSYNNINDTDAAFECIAEFDPGEHAAVAIIKHANPCGVAVADSVAAAYRLALRCDPVSAFGGIVASNRPLDEAAAMEITKVFTEVVIAPEADHAACAVLAKKTDLRLLVTGALPDAGAPGTAVKTVAGGLLVQSRDNGRITASDVKVVTRRAPEARELADLLFAFKVCKHVKSNAIVYAREGATVGIGAGQMSRIDSALIAARKSGEAARAAGLDSLLAKRSVVASDAFFPFADGLLAAADAGVTAVIQPGGSKRDDDVIAAADAAGLAMVFTGMRHFRH